MTRPVPILVLVAGLLAATPAAAEDIPIEISWQGDPPSSISRSGDDGLRNLTPVPGTRIYRGHFRIEGNGTERRTLIISYGTFNFPIDVRIYRQLTGVGFTVTHQAQRSCTEDEVTTVADRSSNLADAINRSLGAGRLLVIPSPNDCDQDLRWGAVQARYRQSVRMAQLSRGLFLVNDQVAADYGGGARARGVSVAGEVMAYSQDERELEAVQLVAARTDAQENRDYLRAAEINDLLTERVRSNQVIREAFRDAGVIELQLRRDGTYLRAMAMSGSR